MIEKVVMKPTALRENGRKIKVNSYQPKSTVSQSPPQKRLLKKIEKTQKENLMTKNDNSFQDNSVNINGKEDFKMEIERRYQNSTANKIYVYTSQNKYILDNYDNESLNSSILSMKYVTVYDLNSQNIKRKEATNIQNRYSAIENKQKLENKFDNSHHNPDTLRYEEEEEIRLEVKIRDKSSKEYMKIFQLLEQHNFLAHNMPKENHPTNNLANQEDKIDKKYRDNSKQNFTNVLNHNVYLNTNNGNSLHINGMSNLEKSNLHSNMKAKELQIYDEKVNNIRSINSKSVPKEGNPNNMTKILIGEKVNRMENIINSEKKMNLNNYSGKG